MSSPYIGEVRIFAGNFAPQGWAFCAGQLVPIAEYETLFTLIGTTYGGDGQNTFALPDLRGRLPVGQGTGPGLSTYVMGQQGGVEEVTLLPQQMPPHSHTLLASGSAALASAGPTGVLAAGSVKVYGAPDAGTAPMHADAIGTAGGSQPHENMAPYGTVNYIISLFGIYPTQG